MTRQSAPPVTETEVLDFLQKDGYARTAPEIAHILWNQRGGEGHPMDATRHGQQPRVPVVRASHVKPVLATLIEKGAVASAVGSDVLTLGSAMQSYREGVTYYTTVEHAEAHGERLAEREALAQRDQAAAVLLAKVFDTDVLRVETSTPGEVRVVFSTPQAEAHAQRPAAQFALDEVDTLVITAGEAVHGDLDDLSTRQRDLADLAYTNHMDALNNDSVTITKTGTDTDSSA